MTGRDPSSPDDSSAARAALRVAETRLLAARDAQRAARTTLEADAAQRAHDDAIRALVVVLSDLRGRELGDAVDRVLDHVRAARERRTSAAPPAAPPRSDHRPSPRLAPRSAGATAAPVSPIAASGSPQH